MSQPLPPLSPPRACLGRKSPRPALCGRRRLLRPFLESHPTYASFPESGPATARRPPSCLWENPRRLTPRSFKSLFIRRNAFFLRPFPRKTARSWSASSSNLSHHPRISPQRPSTAPSRTRNRSPRPSISSSRTSISVSRPSTASSQPSIAFSRPSTARPHRSITRARPSAALSPANIAFSSSSNVSATSLPPRTVRYFLSQKPEI